MTEKKEVKLELPGSFPEDGKPDDREKANNQIESWKKDFQYVMWLTEYVQIRMVIFKEFNNRKLGFAVICSCLNSHRPFHLCNLNVTA